jgi:hypothetical protein
MKIATDGTLVGNAGSAIVMTLEVAVDLDARSGV